MIITVPCSSERIKRKLKSELFELNEKTQMKRTRNETPRPKVTSPDTVK